MAKVRHVFVLAAAALCAFVGCADAEADSNYDLIFESDVVDMGGTPRRT
jgi:hypothetical protein